MKPMVRRVARRAEHLAAYRERGPIGTDRASVLRQRLRENDTGGAECRQLLLFPHSRLAQSWHDRTGARPDRIPATIATDDYARFLRESGYDGR